ncbi:hypothetical protein [Mycoplasmopsis bovigenitalium]|uniref:hypothetical protein n=1 Tax=Mycoplasmopsis bovigenitalium TaxID=2112 RepID=UPI000BBAAF3A|nr:hypothetical protein [Mycoplasmopsis bovigenitalium]
MGLFFNKRWKNDGFFWYLFNFFSILLVIGIFVASLIFKKQASKNPIYEIGISFSFILALGLQIWLGWRTSWFSIITKIFVLVFIAFFALQITKTVQHHSNKILIEEKTLKWVNIGFDIALCFYWLWILIGSIIKMVLTGKEKEWF